VAIGRVLQLLAAILLSSMNRRLSPSAGPELPAFRPNFFSKKIERAPRRWCLAFGGFAAVPVLDNYGWPSAKAFAEPFAEGAPFLRPSLDSVVVHRPLRSSEINLRSSASPGVALVNRLP